MDCCICLDPLAHCKDITKLKCNHTFHFDCISKIKNVSCPLCRDLIYNEPICNGHATIYFHSSTIKKNGTCTQCNKKSFKSILKKYIYI